MDPFDFIAIRFHFGGEFLVHGGNLEYVGGSTAMSYVELDKLSFPEVKGHLVDHMSVTNVMRLHFLKPGEELTKGLLLLYDDASCAVMQKHTTDGGVADIFVEDVRMDIYSGSDTMRQGTEAVQFGSPEQKRMREDKDYRSFVKFYRSPSKVDSLGGNGGATNSEEERDAIHDYDLELDGESDGKSDGSAISDSSDDEEFMPHSDNASSAEDEEAIQLRKFAKEIKKNIKAKKIGIHGSQIGDKNQEDLVPEFPNLDEAGSPYYDSSEDYSYGENSDRETEMWKSLENRYDSKAAVPLFTLGMAFRDSRQFKKALVKYGIKSHKHIVFMKDEKNRVRAACSWPGCKWLIYGSKTSRSEWFKVVTFVDDHICPPRRDNKLVTSTRIAKRYYQEIRDNPNWKAQLIKKAVLRDMLADVSIAQCKRAKQLVLKAALDAMRGEYSRVYDYQLELMRSNPGSTIVVCLNPEFEEKVFERFYVCFDGCKKGFQAGCRRVIGLDGCWFKGAHNGELLCAIARDANNQMYPVAWAAVATETYDSWYWFIGLLQKDLNIGNGGEGWVVISDQQKGLLKAVAELVPNAEHRMCARHIYANWRKKHTDKELQKKWWGCAKAPCRTLFNLRRARLAQDSPEGASDMMKTSPEHWSRAFFKLGSNCDSVDNNLCESFNHSIMDARFLPVISMNEAIRCKIMVRIQENRANAEKWTGSICPNIFRKLKVNIDRSRNCWVLWNGKEGFEVTEKEEKRYTVSLSEKTCTCRYWQLSGLPCCHAISCIYKCSKRLEEFIAPCFSISEYMKTYDHVLHPVQGPDNWPISEMPRPNPPAFVRGPGRHKTERTREAGEAPKGTKLNKIGVKMTCRLCNKNTHNARTCPKNPETGKKKNAHIKRDARKKKKECAAMSQPGSSSKKSRAATDTSRKRKHMDTLVISLASVTFSCLPTLFLMCVK